MDKKIKVAINGFGRIGRAALKIALDKKDIEIVAINDLTNPRILAHLLKYDTVYGTYSKNVTIEENGKKIALSDYRGEKDFYTQISENTYLVIDNNIRIKMYSQKDPTQLPWKDLDVDVVLECTGFFVENDASAAHITAGAKKVIVSAPVKGGATKPFVLGVNHDTYLNEVLVANESCTTNCVSPVVSVIHSKFKVLKSLMTTVHAVTSASNVVDGPPNPRKPDLGLARAFAWNIIPTYTGAAKATTEVIPELQGLFDGISLRVPIMSGSISDITMVVGKKTSVEEVNASIIEAVKNPFYAGIIAATYEPIVSSDVIGSTYSAIVDLASTRVVDGDLIKVLAWYDNEWGYSNRLVEMIFVISNLK